MKTDVCTFMKRTRWIFLRMGNVYRQNLTKIKTHFMSIFFPLVWCRLWDNAEKSGTARQATYRQYNTKHGLFMLDNSGYKQTLKTCNTLHFRSDNICTKAPQRYVCQYVACPVNVNVGGTYSNHWTLKICYDTCEVNSRDIVQFIISRLALQ